MPGSVARRRTRPSETSPCSWAGSSFPSPGSPLPTATRRCRPPTRQRRGQASAPCSTSAGSPCSASASPSSCETRGRRSRPPPSTIPFPLPHHPLPPLGWACSRRTPSRHLSWVASRWRCETPERGRGAPSLGREHGQLALGELAAGARDERGVRCGGVLEREAQPQCLVLVRARADGRAGSRRARPRARVRRRSRPAGPTLPGSSVTPGTRTNRIHMAGPVGQPTREVAASARPPCRSTGGRCRVPGLDVEQHQVGAPAGRRRRGRRAPRTCPARCAAPCLALAEQRRDELRLQQRLAAADGHAAAGHPEEPAVPPTSSMTSSRCVARPSRRCQVSGFWQYRQRSGQPERNSTKRVPGPSTPVEMSQEWTGPPAVRSVRRAAPLRHFSRRGRCG